MLLMKFINQSNSEAAFNVVFKDLKIVSAAWSSAVTITNESAVTINIKCEGTNSFTAYNHPAFSGQGRTDSPIVINITHTTGSTLKLNRSFEPEKGIAFNDTNTNSFVLNIDGKQVGEDLHVHSNSDGVQTCRGYYCSVCKSWYGEGLGHDLNTEQTCKGYQCNTCYQFFGEMNSNKHQWNYGECRICEERYPNDAECTHEWNDGGVCKICGRGCQHPSLNERKCVQYAVITSIISPLQQARQ